LKLSASEFKNWKNKSITLLGMSGVGKTRFANILRSSNWFHYSGDYRIGTRYLDEAILDNIKEQAMQIPFLRDLLRSDSIYIRNNISVKNLNPVSTFLGKLGNPQKGGLDLKEFKRRQNLHRSAEIEAMKDIPSFIHKAHQIYGYKNFINDAGGSVCELDNEDAINVIADNSLIIYIQATKDNESELIKRAQNSPKPLYYREEFLDEQLSLYMQEKNLDYIAMIDPDEFVRWVFPKLFYSRIPRYEAIASKYGYSISTDELAKVNSESDFLSLIEDVLSRA